MYTINSCQTLLKLRLCYTIIAEKWRANQKWGCIAINTDKKLTKRRQLTHLYHRMCFYCRESFRLPYIQLLRKDGMRFMKPRKIPFHLKVTWTESHRTMCKRCTIGRGKVKVVLLLKCIFKPQNIGESTHYPPREIHAKNLVLIIQHSFPNLSIYLHTFMVFIVIINIGINIIQRHQVIRDCWEKHRHLGTECGQKVFTLTFLTMQKLYALF